MAHHLRALAGRTGNRKSDHSRKTKVSLSDHRSLDHYHESFVVASRLLQKETEVRPGFTKEEMTKAAKDDPRAIGGLFEQVGGVLSELLM